MAAYAYWQAVRLFRRDVRLLLVTACLMGLSWDGIRAVLLNLYLLRLGYGPEFIGQLYAAGSVAMAVTCPLAGALGARWRSRWGVIGGLGLIAIGFGLLPLVEFATRPSFLAPWIGPAAWERGWLFGGMVCTNVGVATYLVHSMPLLMEATGPAERNHAFAIQRSLVPLAGFAGSLLAGVLPATFASLLQVSLDDPAVYRYPLWLAAFLVAATVLIMSRAQGTEVRPDPAPGPGSGRAPYALLLVIALVMGLRYGSRNLVLTFFNVYMDNALGATPALIGTLSAAGLLLGGFTALAAPVFVARWGNARFITGGTLGMALGMVPLALVAHWLPAGAGFITATTFFAMTVGPGRHFSQELVAPRWRSSMAAATTMASGLTGAAVSWAGGHAIGAFGYPALFLGAAGLAVVGAWVLAAYFHVPRGDLAYDLYDT